MIVARKRLCLYIVSMNLVHKPAKHYNGSLINNKVTPSMPKPQYITVNQDIFNGAPVLAGTRIPIERLTELWVNGYSEDQLVEEFSGLSKRVIHGAIGELSSIGQSVFAEQIVPPKKP